MSDEITDKDRIDWLEAHPLPTEILGGPDDGHKGNAWGIAAHSGSLRAALDVVICRERHALNKYRPYLFHRAEGFYPIDLPPWPPVAEQIAEHVRLNPGTLKVEDAITGAIVCDWPSYRTPTPTNVRERTL